MGRARSIVGFIAYLASLIAAKAVVISIVVFFSLATTIASFTIPALAGLANGAASWMFGRTVVLTGSEASTLRQRNRALQTRNQDLRASNQRLENQMARQRRVASDGANRIKRRSAYQATRSISAIPAESIPILGVTTIIATTAWDLSDACRTTQDMSEIQKSLGEEPDETFAHLVCDTLRLQDARTRHYGSMTVSQCQEEAAAARDLVFELARAADDEVPDLVFDLDAIEPEIRQVAQEEYDAINVICDCIADLACDLDELLEKQ